MAKRVDQNQRDIVQALRMAGRVVTLLHEVGRGVPDLLVQDPLLDAMVLVEVKAADGRFTPAEYRWLKEWYERGAGVVVVARSADEYLAQLERIWHLCSWNNVAPHRAAKQVFLEHPLVKKCFRLK